MVSSARRVKLTLSLDSDIVAEAKVAAHQKGIPLSRLVENFLRYFTHRYVYCFACGERFTINDTKTCPKCGWLHCPMCEVCRCNVSEEVATAIYHMRRIYEDLLVGRVK